VGTDLVPYGSAPLPAPREPDRPRGNGKGKRPKKPRPTKYTEELAEEICRRIAAGESVCNICKDAHMPDESAIRQWAYKNFHGFTRRFDDATAMRADALFDQLIAIADDTSGDIDYASVYQRKLKIDTRKWMLSKMRPQRYGERIQHERTTNQTLTVRVVKELRTIKQQRLADDRNPAP